MPPGVRDAVLAGRPVPQVYVYVHTHTQRERERERERQTDTRARARALNLSHAYTCMYIELQHLRRFEGDLLRTVSCVAQVC